MDENTRNALKQRAAAAIDVAAGRLTEVSLALRAQPEISWMEVESALRLEEFLRAEGYAVEHGVADLETAFRATLESGRPGPTIAFVAEYDALPGVGHGCGHNLIAAGALGAAVGLRAVLAELGGKVQVLGTPAEEFSTRPQGKLPMLAAGVFKDIDACLMFHPWPVGAPIQSSLAFVALDIVFHGRTAHAAADPWNGLNALDAVIQTYNHISALRQHVEPDVRMHGVITDGGVVPNIIPERAAARFMLRAGKQARVQRVLERVRACAEGAALATGTQLELHLITQVADTASYPTLQALTRANHAWLGVPFEAPVDWTASTDYGDVSYALPAESFFIDLGAGKLPWHSVEVAAATAAAPAQQAMVNGAKVLALDAIDLLAEPALLERARQETPKTTL